MQMMRKIMMKKSTKKTTNINPWLFDGIEFTSDDIKDFQGFVYIIINTLNKKKYIGRKYFYDVRKVPKKRNKKRTESNWKCYWGSSEDLQKDVGEVGEEYFERHILSLHTTRGDCNIEEAKQQFIHNVLESEDYYNGNINGKWKKRPQHITEKRRTSKRRFL